MPWYRDGGEDVFEVFGREWMAAVLAAQKRFIREHGEHGYTCTPVALPPDHPWYRGDRLFCARCNAEWSTAEVPLPASMRSATGDVRTDMLRAPRPQLLAASLVRFPVPGLWFRPALLLGAALLLAIRVAFGFQGSHGVVVENGTVHIEATGEVYPLGRVLDVVGHGYAARTKQGALLCGRNGTLETGPACAAQPEIPLE